MSISQVDVQRMIDGLDALNAGVAAVAQVYAEALAEERVPYPIPAPIDVGRAAAPAPLFAELEHL